MNRAALVRLRAVEERRGLNRVWRLLGATGENLSGPQYGSLRNKYRQYCHDLEELERMADGSTSDLLGNAVAETEDFEREVFCYAVGRALRTRSLNQHAQGGVTDAADRLLAELAKRCCIAVPPITGLEFELGWETLSPLIELVRLRFPGAGIWDLPALAHEFGHYLLGSPPAVDDRDARQLREVRDRLARELEHQPALWRRTAVAPDDPQCLPRVEELIADVFATYAVGPAYPQCCIALRVPLTGLDYLQGAHPPWRYRLTAMLETLSQMAAADGEDPVLSQSQTGLSGLWRALAGEGGPGLPGGDLETLQRWTDEIIGALAGWSDLRYAGGRAVDRVAHLLAVDAAPSDLPRGVTVTHVLNAAWRWRLDQERTLAEVEAVAKASLEYSEHIGRTERDD